MEFKSNYCSDSCKGTSQFSSIAYKNTKRSTMGQERRNALLLLYMGNSLNHEAVIDLLAIFVMGSLPDMESEDKRMAKREEAERTAD